MELVTKQGSMKDPTKFYNRLATYINPPIISATSWPRKLQTEEGLAIILKGQLVFSKFSRLGKRLQKAGKG